MSDRPDREAILSRRARLVALSLAGAGLSLHGTSTPVVQAAPAGAVSASPSARGPAAPSWKDASPEVRKEAQALYTIAQDEMNNGTHERALDALLRAAQLYPHPKVLAALASAWEQVGRPDRALPVYEQILADQETPPKIREEIATSADRARARTGRLTLKIASGEPRSVTMDGVPVEPGTILVLPGKHLLAVRFDGLWPESSRTFEIKAGEQLALEIAPDPGAGPAVCLSPPPPPPPPPPPVHGGGCGCGTPGAPG